MKFKNIINYVRTVCVHKFWVCYYCFIAGLYWRGLVHDLSKFSYDEFSEGIKYYNGNQSTMAFCRNEKGYSLSWLHHRGRNKHHPEYWTEIYDGQEIIVPMPYKYLVEFICNLLGKARSLNDKEGSFSYKSLYNWWKDWKMENTKMVEKDKAFVTTILHYLSMDFKPKIILCNKFLKRIYNKKNNK